MDRRQQKTQNAIIEAFCVLLKEKGYHKITVQEIIDRANIGRSTFYSHFETKDDLLAKICEHLFEHIFTTTFENSEEPMDYRGKQRAIIEHILYHVKHDNKEIVGILIEQGNTICVNSFKEYFYEVIDQYWLENNEYLKAGVPVEIVKNHIYCSFIGILQIWIKGTWSVPIENIREYYMQMV